MLKKRNLTIFFISVIALFLMAGTSVSSASDESFGAGGVVVKDFGFGDDEAYSVAIQPDGKIVVAGYAYNGAEKQLLVARFLASGILDTDFHTNGLFTYGIGGENYEADALLIQDDGKIIVTGIGGSADSGDTYVLKLDADGYLDKTFADDGVRSLPFNGQVVSTALATEPGGSLTVMSSVASVAGDEQVVLARLTSGGTVDASFGDAGRKTVVVSGGFKAESMIGVDGSLLYIAGSAISGTTATASVLRTTWAGELDSSFGADGSVTLFADSEQSVANAVLYDSENKTVWLGGARQAGEYPRAFVAKISENGKLDDGFGAQGVATTSLSYANSIEALALTENSGLIATGFVQSENDQDVFIFSVNGAGTTAETAGATPELQSSAASIAGLSAMRVVDVAKDDDVGYALAVTGSGDILVAGSAGNGENLDLSVLQVNGVSGLAAGGATLQAGVTTSGYYIVTLPVTEITHTGAMTGGQISQTGSSSSTCDEVCSADCATSISPDACYSSCFSTCSSGIVTITQHGVVYSTKPEPEYNSSTSTDSTTTSTTESATDTAGTTTDGSSIFPQGELLGALIVHSGWTEDGSGTGYYTSEIMDVTPGMTYYVRAYAVLSDGTVLYGNEESFDTDDGCFIATAAYGSIFSDEVRAFRNFRDTYLMGNALGEKVVAVYYDISPQFANIIKDNEMLRFMVRLLLFPFYILVYSIENVGAAMTFGLILSVSFLLLAPFMHFRKMRNSRVK